MAETLHVACVQMTSTDSLARNLSVVSQRTRQAAELGCDLLLLPENFAWMGKPGEQLPADSRKVISYFLSQCAMQYRVWLIAGSVFWQDEAHEKPWNRTLVFNPDGELCQHYDKIHLFEAVLAHETWKEADNVQAGKKPSWVSIVDGWKVGLSICYDLRFPHLYRFYAVKGCHMMTVPAAFSQETGQAHWEVLLRARAIENQCYILAAAQSGEHAGGRKTYGHSMIIDPWGNILDELAEGEGMVHAVLSLDKLHAYRQKLPGIQAT